MRTAQFHNFTDKPFTGWWNGKSRVFAPGQKQNMPEYLARHFAKHLANRVLLEKGNETATSPKFPEQVPAFMDEFNKGFQVEDQDEGDDLDVAIALANKKEQPSSNIRTKPNKPLGASSELATPTMEDDEDEEYAGAGK